MCSSHLIYMPQDVNESKTAIPAVRGVANKPASVSATRFDLVPWIVPPIVIPLALAAALAVQILINVWALP